MKPAGPSGGSKPGSDPSQDDGKRSGKRVRRRVMVKFGTGKPDKTGFSKNVSVTGVFIHTTTLFKPGTTLHVAVQFPDRTFNHWATVVWGKQAPASLAHMVECGMGVRFLDPGPEWTAYIEEWKKKLGV